MTTPNERDEHEFQKLPSDDEKAELGERPSRWQRIKDTFAILKMAFLSLFERTEEKEGERATLIAKLQSDLAKAEGEVEALRRRFAESARRPGELIIGIGDGDMPLGSEMELILLRKLDGEIVEGSRKLTVGGITTQSPKPNGAPIDLSNPRRPFRPPTEVSKPREWNSTGRRWINAESNLRQGPRAPHNGQVFPEYAERKGRARRHALSAMEQTAGIDSNPDGPPMRQEDDSNEPDQRDN